MGSDPEEYDIHYSCSEETEWTYMGLCGPLWILSLELQFTQGGGRWTVTRLRL